MASVVATPGVPIPISLFINHKIINAGGGQVWVYKGGPGQDYARNMCFHHNDVR